MIEWSDSQLMIRDAFRRFVEAEIVPNVEELEHGDMPPYEAFCLGGSNSIRGWYDCDLAVGKAFGEITLEYRFPLISIFSGEVFMDAGTDFDTQKDVQGKPGLLLNKDGSGVSVGTGVIVKTPVGPLRLEVATKDFTDDYRFNLGIGWKF